MLGFAPISALAISAFPELVAVFFATADLSAQESLDFKIYAASREYVTAQTDTPTQQPFYGTLVALPTITRTILNGSGIGGVSITWGSVRLDNTDGAYDYLAGNYGVDGQLVVFKVGDPNAAYASFLQMASLLGVRINVADDAVEIELRDNAYRLDVPAQRHVYTGTGDTEGGSDLAGKRKPIVLGQVRNITPAFEIPAELFYRLNDGPVQDITAVYEQGYPLSGSVGDFATDAALRAAAITEGWFATCKATGALRTGAPHGQLTCDVQGDKTGGTYVNTRGKIVRRLVSLTDIADPIELDTVTFDNFEADQPAVIGFYIDPNSTDTVADVIAKLMVPVMGWAGFDMRNTRLQIGLFKAPSGTPIASLATFDLLDFQPEPLPDAFDPPPFRQRVSYEHNWTEIADPLPAAVDTDPARAAWLGLPYRVASTPDSSAVPIKAAHKNAQDPDVVEAYFAFEADATTEAARQLTLANSGYRVNRVTLDLSQNAFSFDIGQMVFVTDERRLFSAGRLTRIAAITDDPTPGNNTVELVVFG